jgi:Fe-S cluster assembly ATP-binding protein
MLSIKNLYAQIEGNSILKGIDLKVNKGEVHAIMGPNGSGKSTLASVIAGRKEYKITDGSISFNGKNIFDMSPEERAIEGLFLSFQYPVEIPGVSVTNFVKTAVNEIRKARNLDPVDPREFLKNMRDNIQLLDMDKKFMSRSLNEGFSGGEKKRNEIFQMAMLKPKLAILDETDSGLDIDALKVVSNGVNKLRNNNNSMIIITHYQRLLNYIKPDYVHILYDGKIIKSGDKTLAIELEEKGYDWIKESYSKEVSINN